MNEKTILLFTQNRFISLQQRYEVAPSFARLMECEVGLSSIHKVKDRIDARRFKYCI